MEELTSGIISSAVWDLIKAGACVTKEFLKKKLSNWVLDDDALNKICEYVNNTPDVYLKSEGLLREYLNIDKETQQILKLATHLKPTFSQNNIDIVNGNFFGNVEGNVITNYSNTQKPTQTNGKQYCFTKKFNEYSPIQIVRSYTSTRDNCTITHEDNEPVVMAEIIIPNKVKELPGCQFAMVLFSFTPSLNLENFYDEDYKLEFTFDTSDNIKLVQLQIKNSQLIQFIDYPLTTKINCISIRKMSSRDSWKDVKEICFTIFADEQYITGEKGYIKISGLRLVQ